MFTSVIDQINQWQNRGETVVLVTGVFDILHIEHIRFLTQAKAAGSKLVVGLESDKRVAQIKGVSRPFLAQSQRLEQVEALKAVNLAFILPEQFSTQPEWESLMFSLHPDIYAVSSHSSFQENKRQICEKYGITFQVVHQHNPEISTTQIIEAFMSRKKG